jgi:hypothetical protein
MVDKIFKGASVIVIGFAYFYYRDSYAIYCKMREVRPDFDAPSIYDMRKILYFAALFSSTKYASKKLFARWVLPYCKDEHDPAL